MTAGVITFLTSVKHLKVFSLQKRSPHVSYSNRIVELLIILNVCDIDENDRLLN